MGARPENPVPGTAGKAPLLAVALVSAAALAYEILLTRVFALVHWHHLVAIAISIALLGYGASGSFLALAGQRLKQHYAAGFVGNALLFAVSAPGCVWLAGHIALDPQAIAWDSSEGLRLAGTFLVLTLPFFAAANCIGLTLWRHGDAIPRVYGFDLVGAALGALAVLPLLALFSADVALLAVPICGLAAALWAALQLRWRRRLTATLVTAGMLALVTGLHPTLAPAPYKDLARALAVSGAEVEQQLDGIAGRLTLVANAKVPLRSAPGLSLQASALPPRQSALFLDGDAVGSLLDHRPPGTPGFLGELVSALPYAVRPARRVAVLAAGGSLLLDQALFHGADSVDAVEPNPLFQRLSCTLVAHLNPQQCDPQRVRWHAQAARAALAGMARQFDLIALPVSADASGLDALTVNFDVTREALAAYLGRLGPRGILAIDGPTRVPPRLALRQFNTARCALLDLGVDNPAEHLAMIRGWQHFSLLLSPVPLSSDDTAAVRAFARQRGFDLVWLPDMQPAEANRFQQLSAPQFHEGARRLLASGDCNADAGRYRLAATRDGAPYAALSTRWDEWWSALRHGGGSERAALDTALLIGSLTVVLIGAAALGLIVLPLLFSRSAASRPAARHPGSAMRLRTLLYFSLLGVAFLFMEIAWLERMQLFLGQPIYAASAVLAAFLLFAGMGSLWTQRHATRGNHLGLALAVVLGCGLLYLYLAPAWLAALAGYALEWRIGFAVLLLAPLAFAMGIPFPYGLRALSRRRPQLVPWAWAINGCMSVVAAAGAPLLSTAVGFEGLVLTAIGAYLLLPAASPARGGEQARSSV